MNAMVLPKAKFSPPVEKQLVLKLNVTLYLLYVLMSRMTEVILAGHEQLEASHNIVIITINFKTNWPVMNFVPYIIKRHRDIHLEYVWD